MIRRSPKSGSAVDQQQEALARRENELRDQMQKLQQMIEDAPRLAQETSRRQRELGKIRRNPIVRLERSQEIRRNPNVRSSCGIRAWPSFAMMIQAKDT
jgi:hypothetical protein